MKEQADTGKKWLRRIALRTAVDALLPASLLVRRVKASRPAVALTFDDGPDELTREYLDVLDAHGAAATFFVLGGAAASRRAEILEIVRRGHEVAGHGYTHRIFPRMSAPELAEELARTSALLPPTPSVPLVRPPQGATSLTSLVRCARHGYTTVLWSIDSDDCRTRSADDVAQNLAPPRVGAGDIVLLHEGQRWTLEALPRVLGALREAGLALVTVGELLRP
jgi:peptidoglycan/xylan/chitin deacetylase (PgdA/CDA1 family)